MASALLNAYAPLKISPAIKSGISRLALRAEDCAPNPQRSRMIPKPKQITPIGVVWDPFGSSRSVKQMIDSMDRMLDSSLSYPPRPARSEGLRGGRTPWDAVDKENEIRMRFDMPGMPREAVKVSVEDNILIIKAEYPREEKEDERWSSRSYGRYYTRIPLPENCKTDGIEAELKDGVLFVTVPKAKEEPKVVNVDVR